MARGERTVVAAGLAVAAIVVGVLGASSWWTVRTYRASTEKARVDQAALVGRVLAGGVERLLADDETTGVRRLVTDSTFLYNLDSARIVLGNGKVLADAKTENITAMELPAQFPPLDTAAEFRVVRVGRLVQVSAPLTVMGKGQARLEISAVAAPPAWADWETQAGIGVIAVTALSGLLVVYRAMRTRWRAIGAVADALHLEASGNAGEGALVVGEKFGPLATAWNQLIAERDRLRVGALMQEAAKTIEERGGRDGDLKAACDAMWQGLVVLDGAGMVRYCNGAAAVLLRSKRESVTGTPISTYLDDAAAQEIISKVMSGQSKSRASIEVERAAAGAQDRTVLRLSVRPLRREDGPAAMLIIEDTTQQRVADESRNAFVAQATHELRTPLTNIRLYVEALVEEGDDAQARAKCLNVIGAESRRLERIVGDMLSVSEIEAGALKLRSGEVRVDAMLEELEADFRAQAEDKEIKLVFELPPKLPVMQGDRDKLMLALHNLLGNALKYTPTGGQVRVKIEEAGGKLAVAVIDNGIGINKDEQEMVFEKFYRAKDRRIANITGSGIGLALARQVVRLHGGDITCDSQIDKGSTFTLTVPLTAEVAEPRLAA
ncbi:MAG: ATP-binding protein [Phycisphaerales bacterium]